jgi:hypothetical protein
MDAPVPQTPSGLDLAHVGVRRLQPASTTIFEGTFSLLHVAIKGDSLYRAVFAMRMFPIRLPERYISLHYTDTSEKEREIGIIDDLTAFPEEQQLLVRRSLSLQYHEQFVNRIHEIRTEYGLLFFDVETQRGREQFTMPWRGDRAEDFGEHGKVLLDAFDNRFIITDLTALPQRDLQRLRNYIYW